MAGQSRTATRLIEDEGLSLFAYPAQSNMTGRRLPSGLDSKDKRYDPPTTATHLHPP